MSTINGIIMYLHVPKLVPFVAYCGTNLIFTCHCCMINLHMFLNNILKAQRSSYSSSASLFAQVCKQSDLTSVVCQSRTLSAPYHIASIQARGPGEHCLRMRYNYQKT